LPAIENETMTNHDYMNLMTQWVRADHDPAFVALPFSNGLPPSGGVLALRCNFSEDTPDLMQLWFMLDEVDSKGVDHLVDMLEANDQIDEQVEGLGYFALLNEGTLEHFAWVVRMPFTSASTVNDLRGAVARGSAHAAQRWQAALPH
jgi:hypothetical protein